MITSRITMYIISFTTVLFTVALVTIIILMYATLYLTHMWYKNNKPSREYFNLKNDIHYNGSCA